MRRTSRRCRGRRGIGIQAIFDNIGSLKLKAPVKSSGVIVGRVVDIAFSAEDYHAVVGLEIETNFTFPEDSDFSIVSSNLLGGQYVEIEPGAEEVMLATGDQVFGNSAIVLEHLISKFFFDKAEEGN